MKYKRASLSALHSLALFPDSWVSELGMLALPSTATTAGISFPLRSKPNPWLLVIPLGRPYLPPSLVCMPHCCVVLVVKEGCH